MSKRTLLALLILICIGLCYAATSDPWDGTGWNVAAPDIDQPHGNDYKEIQDLRKGVALRLNKEHETLAASSAGGVHKQGSARAFFQDAAPTTQIDGTAWDSGDTGSLWFDTNATPDNLVYVLTNHASTGTWTLLSTSMTAEIVAAAHTWADNQTFSGTIAANGTITLGAGDDLVGSSTSDITFNTNKFTVAGASGNVVIAGTGSVGGTLDVTGNLDPTTYETTNGGFQNSDTMASAGDDKVASSDSIVKYATLDAGGVIMHDAEGSFNNCDIDGTKTKVYTIYLTGTLDADAETSVAHGVTGVDNILAVSVACYTTGATAYRVSEVFAAAAATEAYVVRYDGTNIIIGTVGSSVQGQKYRIKIDYKL